MQHLGDINQQSDITGAFFCGAMAVLVFFVGILYFKSKERIYFYYVLFLVFSLGYGLVSITGATWMGELLGGNFQGNRRFVEPVTLLAFAAYIAFSMELIGIRHYSRSVANVFSVWAMACVFYAVIYFVAYHAILDYALPIFMTVRVIIFSLSFYFLIWIIKNTHSPVKTPFLWGSFAYFIGAVLASIRFSFPDLPVPRLYDVASASYFEMGILVETLCFTIALGQRLVIITNEKEQTQQRHIERISEKRRLVSKQNEQLERRVEAREKIILRARKRLLNEEELRLKAEFERELARSETLARSLEINPHFLYNCLNSIMYLIQSDQNKKASEYLTVFSRFIRLVLETSRRPAIPLVEELDIIEKYLKLERNRFGQDFSYSILGANHSIHGVMVPPMLLYLVVENAVWHGVMNSPHQNKEIKLCIVPGERSLTILITDNGVGWISGQRKSQSNELGVQKGISLTKERIKLFNHSYENKIDFDVKEVNDEIRRGTEATFVITLSESETIT